MSYQEIFVAESFGNMDAEIESCKSTVGIFHTPHIGLIECEGTDVLDLLQRMSTNNVIDIQEYEQIPTILTNENGRIIDILYVFSVNSSIYIMCSPNNETKVIDWLERYTFMEDASFHNISTHFTSFQLQGPKAFDLIKTVFHLENNIENKDVISCRSDGLDVLAVHQKINLRPFFLILTPPKLGAKTWEQFTDLGATPVGIKAWEVARVDAGIPRITKEITEKTNPLEIGAIGAIDFAKGCYIGQEVIARLDTYNKVQKRLVMLDIADDTGLNENTNLVIDNKKVGTITSINPRKANGHVTAMGYVKPEYANAGQHICFQGSTATGIIKNVPILFEST